MALNYPRRVDIANAADVDVSCIEREVGTYLGRGCDVEEMVEVYTRLYWTIAVLGEKKAAALLSALVRMGLEIEGRREGKKRGVFLFNELVSHLKRTKSDEDTKSFIGLFESEEYFHVLGISAGQQRAEKRPRAGTGPEKKEFVFLEPRIDEGCGAKKRKRAGKGEKNKSVREHRREGAEQAHKRILETRKADAEYREKVKRMYDVAKS